MADRQVLLPDGQGYIETTEQAVIVGGSGYTESIPSAVGVTAVADATTGATTSATPAVLTVSTVASATAGATLSNTTATVGTAVSAEANAITGVTTSATPATLTVSAEANATTGATTSATPATLTVSAEANATTGVTTSATPATLTVSAEANATTGVTLSNTIAVVGDVVSAAANATTGGTQSDTAAALTVAAIANATTGATESNTTANVGAGVSAIANATTGVTQSDTAAALTVAAVANATTGATESNTTAELVADVTAVINASTGATLSNTTATVKGQLKLIQTLIDKKDSVEIVRDQIGAIIFAEVNNQQALAIAAGKDPEEWRMRVFLERSNPWEEFLAETVTDTTPIINIWFDQATYDLSSSNIMERQKATGTYNIDCYGYGISSDNPGGGYNPGDQLAAFETQRALRLIRNMLMAAENTYLQLRGLVWRRWPQSMNAFQPTLDAQDVQKVLASRLTFSVEFNEFAPQITGEDLGFIAVDVFRSETGELLLEADFPSTP